MTNPLFNIVWQQKINGKVMSAKILFQNNQPLKLYFGVKNSKAESQDENVCCLFFFFFVVP